MYTAHHCTLMQTVWPCLAQNILRYDAVGRLFWGFQPLSVEAFNIQHPKVQAFRGWHCCGLDAHLQPLQRHTAQPSHALQNFANWILSIHIDLHHTGCRVAIWCSMLMYPECMLRAVCAVKNPRIWRDHPHDNIICEWANGRASESHAQVCVFVRFKAKVSKIHQNPMYHCHIQHHMMYKPRFTRSKNKHVFMLFEQCVLCVLYHMFNHVFCVHECCIL